MKRYFIEDVKCGITEDGMACGPIGGNIVATISFKEEDKTQWISLVEVTGIPIFYLSDKDIYEDLLKEDFEDEEFMAYANEHQIHDFNGIALSAEYDEIFDSIARSPENPAVPLIKYLITIVRCSEDEVEPLISIAEGKYADELDVPMSDVEEDYLELKEEDEDY